MCDGDDADDNYKHGECGAGARQPQDNQRKECDSGGLNIVIHCNTGDNERLGVKKEKIEVCEDDEETAQKGERGGKNGKAGHDEQDDEVVECVVFEVFLDTVEEVCELGLGHLGGVEKLGPGATARPYVTHA